MQTNTLKVPGATLYYETRGSGPVLLMIAGGPMDAGGFAALAERLADRYTVMTYDCRGNSRSPRDPADDDLSVEVLADDADRLLELAGPEPAYVLGSSGGAIYGLDLVARYPGRVHTLVAHEPPVSSLLPDADRWRAFNESIGAAYRNDGVYAAMQKFAAGSGLGGGGAREASTPEAIAATSRMMGNLELFASRLIPVVGNYVPDIAALRASSTRIVVGVGQGSTPEMLPYRTAHALAGELGVSPTVFPGDHGGFGSDPDAFAAKLRAILADPGNGADSSRWTADVNQPLR
jgi:pimeloyl-ACP methyl ester carboxylesterase